MRCVPKVPDVGVGVGVDDVGVDVDVAIEEAFVVGIDRVGVVL